MKRIYGTSNNTPDDCLKSKIRSFIENFNKDFDTNLKMNNKPLLTSIFHNFINQFTTQVKSSNTIDELCEINEKLDNTLSSEQMELLNKWNRLQENYFCDMIEQSFIYGYCTCKQLDIESK